MSDEEKHAHPVDIHVGRRVRMARMAIGLSQIALAELLHLSFQQVQKYESGDNRVSASRLYEISSITGFSIDWFFEGIGDDPADHPTPVAAEPLRHWEWQMIQTFRALPPQVQSHVAKLIRLLLPDRDE